MLHSAALQFSSVVKQISPLGNGLINDTYLLTTSDLPLVLQRINHQVFPFPEQIMANLRVLNQHIRQKHTATIQLPEIINTLSNNSFYRDKQGNYWRALSFIANTESLETMSCLNHAEQTGYALGHFHRLLSDLNPAQLHDTLPDFHITPSYLKHYQQVLTQTPVQPEDRYCAEFITRFQSVTDELEIAKQQGLLTMRVIHGDPKLNNFLFDRNTQKIISIIDLDTVKPGLVHYDIGDCLRSCCQTVQDEFDVDICKSLLKAYLNEAKVFFSGQDYQYLYSAIRLIPFELGLRFYTDYLQGNRYFKVTARKQNLQRAQAQFRLTASIMAQESTIRQLIDDLRSTD